MNRFKELHKEKNLSQGLLAEIFGVSLRTLRRWKCGESQIRTNKIKQLVNYFGVTEGYLLGYIDNFLDDNQKETGHTEEAPRYVKNILARLRELPPNDHEVWLKAIIGEFDGKVFWCGECYKLRTKFTHTELEDAGFGWVFKCKGVKVEEVE